MVTTHVEELIKRNRHRAIVLWPIKCVWGQAKRYTHANCDYSFAGLEKIIHTALDSVNVELIWKVREYHRAYREGLGVGKEMQISLKFKVIQKPSACP